MLALLLALPTSASAEEYICSDFSFTLPEEFLYTLTPATPSTSALWALAGVADPATTLEEYRDAGVTAEFFTEDGKSFNLRENSTKYTESVYHLSSLTEEEQENFLKNRLASSQSDDATVEKTLLNFGGQPFYRVKIDVARQDEEAHELLYGTIVNGRTIAFDLYRAGDAPGDEEIALLESAVQSIQFTSLLPKPEPQETSPFLIGGLLLALVLTVLTPVVYVPLRRRRVARQKTEMSRRLTEYRSAHKEEISGPALFVNETDCTKEMIRAFARYQAYTKGLVSLLLGGALCVAILIVAFLFDLTWWIKVLAAGVTIYYLYKVINMPHTIERAQQKVFSRGLSETARYTFFEEGFRVSGIQSSNTYPYFQILSVKKSGQYLFLYYTAENIYPVDVYGFAGDENESLDKAQGFERFIKEKVGK